MSATEDESQGLDAGWDHEPSSLSSSDEAEVDEAWDSLPPPVNRVSAGAAAPSIPPATEEVDSGWDDVPAGAPGTAGKRRPHRQRRAKSGSNAVAASSSPVLLPRPAEPSKKQQREHTRKQRAYEAQLKQQRKLERKAQRAAEVRDEAAARQRQAEAEEAARKLRRDARDRAESEQRRKQAARKASASKPSRAVGAKPRLAEAKPAASVVPTRTRKRGGLRPGVVMTLLVLAAAGFFLVFRR